MARLTVTFDGEEVFSRECETFSCEESVHGTFAAQATFPAIENDILTTWEHRTPTGTLLDGMDGIVNG